MLAALEEMLANLGYEPAGFTDSRAALEAFRADPRRFEAVISDEVMPSLTGTQLAVELRRAEPRDPDRDRDAATAARASRRAPSRRA